MADPARITVTCEPDADGWQCRVTVGDDPEGTEHRVGVSAETLRDLAGGDETPERLVEASFHYLLEREPRESILRAFALPEIGRYFPGYEAEIRRRLAG
jgi:hypothetical protein